MQRLRTARPGVVPSIVYDVEPLWRHTLASLLERRNAAPVAVCASIAELEDALTREPTPRLLVADPGEGAALDSFLRALDVAGRQLSTIVVSHTQNGSWRRSLDEGGVVAFVAKEHEIDVIEDALREAIDANIPLSRLTRRELEVLELVGRGQSNREIAATLWLSDQTVKFHLANIYRRLGVGCRADAVAAARRARLLPSKPGHAVAEGVDAAAS